MSTLSVTSPATTISASFRVSYHQYLNAEGDLVQALPVCLEQPLSTLVTLYQLMYRTRTFDNKAIALQRTGKLGTFPSSLGQEAISVGIGYALDKDDVFCPYYREHGALLQRGMTMVDLLSYWGGDERGNDFKTHIDDFPINVPIASQCLHAVGVAYAMQWRKQPRVALTICGDGATSKGDFYEAINAAGVYQLPVVFVINNNQWAISTPCQHQTRAQTLAQKAIAAGFEGLQADGNDIIAVYATLCAALKKAREGGGPTLIEMLSYRLSDHTTADDASRYVPTEALQAAKHKDPLLRLKRYLIAQGGWSDTQEAKLAAQCQEVVNQAVHAYLHRSPQPPTALFDYLYAVLPDALRAQRDECVTRARK